MPYIARQPIFNRSEQVIGYELLFRGALENMCLCADSTATNFTSPTSLLTGIQSLCGPQRAFVNCTQEMLIRGTPTLLPPKVLGIEVMESVTADEPVVRACIDLKKAGYTIALAHFVPNGNTLALLPFADILKIDVQVTSLDGCLRLVQPFRHKAQLLAENVETRDQFRATLTQGFDFFQGSFFRKPVMVSTSELPPSALACVRVLQAVNRPELNLSELEQIIKSEPSFCYRLLRYLNSATFFLQSGVNSIRHALALLGEREIRRWLRLMATVLARGGAADGLIIHALTRARFCELISKKVNRSGDDGFIMGLFSLMEAILGLKMEVLLSLVPLSTDAQEALTGNPSRLRSVLDIAVAYEAAQWDDVARLATELKIQDEDVAKCYCAAVRWSEDTGRFDGAQRGAPVSDSPARPKPSPDRAFS